MVHTVLFIIGGLHRQRVSPEVELSTHVAKFANVLITFLSESELVSSYQILTKVLCLLAVLYKECSLINLK